MVLSYRCTNVIYWDSFEAGGGGRGSSLAFVHITGGLDSIMNGTTIRRFNVSFQINITKTHFPGTRA